MGQKTLRRRVISALLALALVWSFTPAGFAVAVGEYYTCQTCGNLHAVITGIVKTANCHEQGEVTYVCHNVTCPNREQTQHGTTEIDPENHDAIYEDNGDGTHSAKCTYHPEVGIEKEEHTYGSNGLCTKCMAVNYSQVKLTLPSEKTVYVSLGDTNASISLGDVSACIGTADITDQYTMSYSWFYGGIQVGSGAEYTLPVDVTSTEGTYRYVCFVMAVAKNGTPLNGSCTITLRVEDLITARAVISNEEASIDLGTVGSRMEQSVEEQIYEQACEASTGEPSYVVFGEKPESNIGSFNAVSGTNYTFGDNGSLVKLSFVPTGKATGTYTIDFTVYDNKGLDYHGILTFTVEQHVGDLDVVYSTTATEPVDLDVGAFEDFWLKTYAKGSLLLLRFSELPTATRGTLYYDYVSTARPGTRVKAGENYYVDPAQDQHGINSLTFVPGSQGASYVEIPFEVYGLNNSGVSTYLSGSLFVFISSGTVKDVAVAIPAAGSVALDAQSFLETCQTALGTTTSSDFYIQLLDIPASGALYVNRTEKNNGTRLTSAALSSYIFYYNTTRGTRIGDLTYIAGTSETDTVRYVAFDNLGKMLYLGQIVFTKEKTVDPPTIRYDVTSTTSAAFLSSDFGAALGTDDSSIGIQFTQPNTGGILYYTASTGGRAKVTTSHTFYMGTGTPSINNLIFVPTAGYTGTVNIPFTVVGGEDNVAASGTVKIVVAAASTSTGTDNKEDENNNKDNEDNKDDDASTTPKLTFTDVPDDAWYYSNLADLVAQNVINGYEDNTFRPNGEVTYGQALKMIMLAAGYGEQAPSDSHWASGYLKLAKEEELLSSDVTNLDRKISRYVIAEIAAKALNLTKTKLTKSPFADMEMSVSSAPYVLALYENGIVTGSTSTSGVLNYYGVNSIRRSEMAAIIWRMYNYARGVETPGQAQSSIVSGDVGDETAAVETAEVTEESALAAIQALQKDFPEGMPWTNENSYTSTALHAAGYGCEAFALLCSDAAFGDLPLSSTHSDFSAIRVGDLVRMNNDTHTAIVLEKHDSSIVVAEGNYNASIHWGREITQEELKEGNFTVRTRYPA